MVAEAVRPHGGDNFWKGSLCSGKLAGQCTLSAPRGSPFWPRRADTDICEPICAGQVGDPGQGSPPSLSGQLLGGQGWWGATTLLRGRWGGGWVFAKGPQG